MPVSWDVRVVSSVPSTMDTIDALAMEGHPEGVVFRAEEQTGGRGRAGRTWSVPAGSSLTFSLLLRPERPPDELGMMALMAAHAVVSAVVACGAPAQVKWPNDVLIHGRKVAGILIRTRQAPGMAHPWVNVGVGINVNVKPAFVPESATSLQAVLGKPFDLERLFRTVLDKLEAAYDLFRRDDMSPILSDLNERLAYRGETVVVQEGAEEVRGRVECIGECGELVLTLPDGAAHSIVSGELVRGPRPVSKADRA